MASITSQLRDTRSSGATLLWITGIVFIAVALAAYFGSKSAPHWFAPVVGLAGMLIIGLAIYLSMSIEIYGDSVFESSEMPVAAGSVLTGTVRLEKSFTYLEPIKIRLACLKTVLPAKNPGETALWEENKTADQFTVGSQVNEFPVSLAIPANAQPSATGNISWVLEVSAETHGPNYRAEFLIQVK